MIPKSLLSDYNILTIKLGGLFRLISLNKKLQGVNMYTTVGETIIIAIFVALSCSNRRKPKDIRYFLLPSLNA